ncbi:MAG: helix-turn-helix transcriptional regulator [Synergistaceae bacterium]|nr:helix-turn-helix transcriptional regulator [Synergistaceae bacterium]MBQ7169385.1 helix-turn-helix transcriptional regulator [Synergistaceae bacterium]
MLNEVIRTLRKRRGLTQEQLAEQLGVSVMTVRRWEWGERVPNADDLRKASQVLDIPVTELMGDSDTLHIMASADAESFKPAQATMRKSGNMLVYERNGERMELPPTQESYAIFKEIARMIAGREAAQPAAV